MSRSVRRLHHLRQLRSRTAKGRNSRPPTVSLRQGRMAIIRGEGRVHGVGMDTGATRPGTIGAGRGPRGTTLAMIVDGGEAVKIRLLTVESALRSLARTKETSHVATAMAAMGRPELLHLQRLRLHRLLPDSPEHPRPCRGRPQGIRLRQVRASWRKSAKDLRRGWWFLASPVSLRTMTATLECQLGLTFDRSPPEGR